MDNDEYKNLKTDFIPINKIIPTQKNLTLSNLETTEDVGNNTGAYLFKYNDMYYVLDGHHRISNRILNGDKEIEAYVYDEEIKKPTYK